MRSFIKQSVKRNAGVILSVALSCLLVAGCASTKGSGGQASAANEGSASNDDPLEGYNRVMFKINDIVDQAVMQPVAMGYRKFIPKPARNCVRNFLHNLHTPINAGNNLLQGDIEGVATDLSRFMINTTIGIAGLFDVAKETGLSYRPEDFGQTMGVWGISPGPYLVLPLLGPSSIRDTVGLAADSYADPVRIYLRNTDRMGLYYTRVALIGLDNREALLDAIWDLRKHSIDFYAATRSAYFQERDAMVHNHRAGAPAASANSIPDYDHP